MKTFAQKLILTLLVPLILALPRVTLADPQSPYMQYAQGERGTDKSRAADIARAAHGGKVLKVDEVSADGRTLYRVKLLLDGGRIKIVTVDGSSGRII